MSDLDRPEKIVAAKRTERWSPEDREWLEKLPDSERDLVLLAAAHLNAMPVDDSEACDISDPKHPSHHDVYSDLADMHDD